jgi:hypothetical protein
VKADVYREFIIPDDEEVYEAVGEWPDSEESGARVLTVQDNSGQSLIFSVNPQLAFPPPQVNQPSTFPSISTRASAQAH